MIVPAGPPTIGFVEQAKDQRNALWSGLFSCFLLGPLGDTADPVIVQAETGGDSGHSVYVGMIPANLEVICEMSDNTGRRIMISRQTSNMSNHTIPRKKMRLRFSLAMVGVAVGLLFGGAANAVEKLKRAHVYETSQPNQKGALWAADDAVPHSPGDGAASDHLRAGVFHVAAGTGLPSMP